MATATDSRAMKRISLLFAAAVFINYADRGNLSTVAPSLKDALRMTNTQMGLLLSAFFWIYAPAQLFAGWFAQRFPVRQVLAAGLIIWSLATIGTGLVSGITALFALRLMLGVGEAAFFPCSSKLLAEVSPEEERGRANGLNSAGIALGPMAGTLIGGLILAQFGWRWVFLSFGLLSLLWLWPWLTTAHPAPLPQPEPDEALPPPGYGDLIRQRAAWGAAVGHFCHNYAHYMMLTWMPTYLVKGQGFSLGAMAAIGGAVYFAQAVGALVSGRLSDRMIEDGSPVNRVRKGFMLAGTGGLGVCMIACGFAGGQLAALLLLLGGFFSGVGSPMIYTIAQTLAGPRAGGRWMGLQNFVGNLAGIVAPIITGKVVDVTGSYFWAFATAGMICGIGLLSWSVVIATVAPVRWSSRVRATALV